MPQARRKTPFSGKAKKQQLQTKKQNKVMVVPSSSNTDAYDTVALNYQPSKGRNPRDTNRYALKFYRETDEELNMKKEDSLKAINPVSEKDLEVDPLPMYPAELSFPKRPSWDFNMTPAQLDAQEHRYFKNYIDKLQASEHWKDMSYFELNLETWRQLWRVMEMCDVLLLIVDARFAGLMCPPSLYTHIVRDLNKSMIIVLNKIDLVPAPAVLAWKQYLSRLYPGVRIIYFTSCPGYNVRGATQDKAGLQIRRRKGRLRMCVEGSTQLLEACREIVGDAVDLSSWEQKIKEEMEESDGDDDQIQVGETIIEKPDTSYFEHSRLAHGVLTVGCCGQPNVGKSSLMNAVLGTKRLSVSKTPGHTKHFQTIFATPTVRFCDCPGLVFPSKVPRAVQILMGSYPIAQLREPYTTIRYLAERIPLPALLRIQHPESEASWSPRDICDGWAKKRGYLTAKAARLDTYRAANSLLRMALDGSICLWLRPPHYTRDLETLEKSEELKYIKWVQALTSDESTPDVAVASDKSDDSDESDASGSDSDSTDADENIAIANKFAALASEN